ncbi:MAG: nucleotide exchange factor GrpE [Anaerolineae bacterium]|nr:nucleotide exchange factor GrpE [Anaerolineae bacterium]
MSRDETTNNTHEAPAGEAAENTQQAEPAPQSSADTLTAELKQAQDYLAGWQRERAEFNNYKRRVEREMKDIAQNASAETLFQIIPIIDDLERAFTHIPAELEGNVWVDGVIGIHRKFQKLVDELGLTIIDPVGQPFDPSRHEAVGMEDSSEIESGHVTTTLQKGYARGERILRSALVRVAN